MNWRKTPLLLALAAAFVLLGSALAEDKNEEGFVPLFNGKNLSGFKTVVYEGGNGKNTFFAKDGILHITGTPGGHVYTEKVYKNYVLRFEWKFPKRQGNNSGCFVHIDPKGKQTWIEVQGAETEHGRIMPGGATDRIAQKKAIKIGEWNTTEIISQDGELTSKVNGITVSTSEHGRTEGHIGFQSEGSPVMFKNIRIKVVK